MELWWHHCLNAPSHWGIMGGVGLLAALGQGVCILICVCVHVCACWAKNPPTDCDKSEQRRLISHTRHRIISAFALHATFLLLLVSTVNIFQFLHTWSSNNIVFFFSSVCAIKIKEYTDVVKTLNAFHRRSTLKWRKMTKIIILFSSRCNHERMAMRNQITLINGLNLLSSFTLIQICKRRAAGAE